VENRVVSLILVVFLLIWSPALLAKIVSGTKAVVSGVTHIGGNVSAAVTTDSTGTGTYTLRFFLRSPGAETGVYLSASPSTIPVDGNASTVFSGRISSLECGKSYEVTGVFTDMEGKSYTVTPSPSYTLFSTLPCASISPAAVSINVFENSSIGSIAFKTTNFNGAVRFQIAPALPSGLLFNSSTGEISGTATQPSKRSRHTITVVGSTSGSVNAEVTLTVAPTLSDLDVLRYIASHGDLINVFGLDVVKARQHYLDWGYNEDRAITFVPLNYTASHPDLMAAFGEDEAKAVAHYISWGYRERRAVTFNPLQYIASHPDLISAFGADARKGAGHYIKFGYAERRAITFDPLRYTATHPDLIAQFGADEDKAAIHFIKFGSSERRQVLFSDFDALSYVASYGDLITSLGSDAAAGMRDYVSRGYNSGRRIVFDALSYIASYPDLITAFGTDKFAAVNHYINWGYKEGRKVLFDALGYLAANADVRAAFGADRDAATRHYISYGSKEGRGFLWTVSVNAGKGGRTQSSREYVQSGRTVFFFIDADPGYRIGTASGCNGVLYKMLETQATYTTGPITGTCSINVTFDELKPIIWVSDAALDFGDLTISLTSAYKTITIRNNGNTFLSLGQIRLTGDGANQFLMSSSCGSTIAAGSGCSVSIAFRPTSTGSKLASLAIAHNSLSGSTVIPLSGAGSDYLAKCSNCVELRQVRAGDQWSLSVTEQEFGVVSAIAKEFKVDRVASIGPRYSAGGAKVQPTIRITDTYSLPGTPSSSQYSDYADALGDNRLRMLGRGEVNGDSWAIAVSDFDIGNYPTFLVSPIGVGAEWAFQADFWGPPCFGCLATTKQIERFNYRASVKAIDVIKTPMGNVEAFRIEYTIICRRGYSSTSLAPNLECVSSDKYLGESGTIWVNQRLGIIQQDTIINSGFSSTSSPLRTRIVGKLVSTNIQ
jgi:hypothetical protein